MKMKLGVDEKVNAKCPNGYPLKVHTGKVYKYHNQSRPICKGCNQKYLDEFEFFYRCSNRACDCNYDLCRICTLTHSDPPLLQDTIKRDYVFSGFLQRIAPNTDSWTCRSKYLSKYKELVPDGECQLKRVK